jgi:carbon storage regulator
MLMMTRRKGETIRIGDDIELIILACGPHSRVKVGIRAPREILVVPREIKLIRDENLRAATATIADLPGLVARFQPTLPVELKQREKVGRAATGPARRS